MVGAIEFHFGTQCIYVPVCPKNPGYGTVIDFSSHKLTPKIIFKNIWKKSGLTAKILQPTLVKINLRNGGIENYCKISLLLFDITIRQIKRSWKQVIQHIAPTFGALRANGLNHTIPRLWQIWAIFWPFSSHPDFFSKTRLSFEFTETHPDKWCTKLLQTLNRDNLSDLRQTLEKHRVE